MNQLMQISRVVRTRKWDFHEFPMGIYPTLSFFFIGRRNTFIQSWNDWAFGSCKWWCFFLFLIFKFSPLAGERIQFGRYFYRWVENNLLILVLLNFVRKNCSSNRLTAWGGKTTVLAQRLVVLLQDLGDKRKSIKHLSNKKPSLF